MEFTVITPTIPERRDLLMENMESVANQHLSASAHLIGTDYDKVGPVEMRNKLLKGVDTEWTAFLDDDDLFLPNHLSTMASKVKEADLIWTWCNVEGRQGFNPNRRGFNEGLLRETGNYIPITVAVKTELVNKVGGFIEHPQEDWFLWIRLLDIGAKFTLVPVVTWTYRFVGENRSVYED